MRAAKRIPHIRRHSGPGIHRLLPVESGRRSEYPGRQRRGPEPRCVGGLPARDILLCTCVLVLDQLGGGNGMFPFAVPFFLSVEHLFEMLGLSCISNREMDCSLSRLLSHLDGTGTLFLHSLEPTAPFLYITHLHYTVPYNTPSLHIFQQPPPSTVRAITASTNVSLYHPRSRTKYTEEDPFMASVCPFSTHSSPPDRLSYVLTRKS